MCKDTGAAVCEVFEGASGGGEGIQRAEAEAGVTVWRQPTGIYAGENGVCGDVYKVGRRRR